MLSVWGKGAVQELPPNTAGNIRPNEALLEQWIKSAWNDISPQSIICCMSNDMNGTEDDIWWEEDHEENHLPVVKVQAVTSDLFVMFWYINTLGDNLSGFFS